MGAAIPPDPQTITFIVTRATAWAPFPILSRRSLSKALTTSFFVVRRGLCELANRVGHHPAERHEEALGRFIPFHQAIASMPVAKRPMMSFWIWVVPS